ncbi:MAG: adenine phosphoribosyltransferase, partial [Cyanobacteria bacterium PR.023]|nr:adenine phosphoribosyltransferase [Cyanobacteria bacterium PR.023]
LLKKLGANVVGAGFIVELDFLDGRKKLLEDQELDVYSVIHY